MHLSNAPHSDSPFVIISFTHAHCTDATLCRQPANPKADSRKSPPYAAIYSPCLPQILLFFSGPRLDPRVGHIMNVLSPFIPVLFHRESCPRLDVVYSSRAWSSSPACTWHCSLHYLFLQATLLFPHGVTTVGLHALSIFLLLHFMQHVKLCYSYMIRKRANDTKHRRNMTILSTPNSVCIMYA